MNIKQLRQTILDRAIRGQLVSQDPTDEPASVLLERIRAEKEELIKEKKLKREKRDSQPIEEVPFEIPEGWVWCRLGDIAQSNIGLTYSPNNVSINGTPVLRSNNIKDDKLLLNDLVRVSGDIQEKNYIKEGDILICARNGSRNLLGKSTIINNLEEPMTFGAFMAICRSLYNHWIFQTLRTDYFQRYLDFSNSTAINQITQSMLLEFPIPLPPLKEQHRIVRKIEQLFALVDIIEVNKKALEKLIEQAKNQVLSDAVAGKLTHQDPNDEPAEELLKRIGKTTAPDTPYEKLPKGWAWCRLGDIGKILTGNTPSKGERAFYGNDFPFFKPNDLDIGKVQTSLNSLSVLGYKQARKVPKGSILVTCIGSIGKTGITQVEGAFNQQINAIIPFECIDNYFIYYLILSKEIQEQLNTKASATTIAILNKSKFENTLIPLPPLVEQHRIVKKIETYFSFFDMIENNL